MKSTFAIAEVKAAPSENPNGEFEIVMSTDSVDRDGEIIDKGAFEPLPASIPVHAFHDFTRPIGRAVPGYDDQGRLVGRGFFGSDAESQLFRQKVADGLIGHTSVGFMAAERNTKEGTPHITRAELLEVSFVSVPSNRDAAVLMAKEYAEKAGARNSAKDSERLQGIHDYAVENGALCGEKSHTPESPEPAAASAETDPETAAPAVKSPVTGSAFLAAAKAQAEAASVL